MLSTLLIGVAAAYLRGEPGQVALPFPDVKEAEDALQASQPEAPAPEAEAPVEEQAAPQPETVSAWHMPTLKPDPMVEGVDAFKHPTQEMIKDWETAPKIDMFDAPTEKPIEDPMKVQADASEVADPEKKVEAALPAVQSKLHPVNPYGKLDDNPELAAIQRESPDAYGIVKALMMKKQMGLPLPGAEAAANAQSAREQMSGERQQNPDASTGHINNMWNWHPKDSASDEIAVTQEMSDTVEAPAPTDAPAPAAVEAPVEAPAPELPAVTEAAAPVEEAPAAPAPAEAPAAGMMAMNSWLGATVKAPAPVEREVQVPKQGADLMSKYALDLA